MHITEFQNRWNVLNAQIADQPGLTVPREASHSVLIRQLEQWRSHVAIDRFQGAMDIVQEPLHMLCWRIYLELAAS
jgi:hypothetical protein